MYICSRKGAVSEEEETKRIGVSKGISEVKEVKEVRELKEVKDDPP